MVEIATPYSLFLNIYSKIIYIIIFEPMYWTNLCSGTHLLKLKKNLENQYLQYARNLKYLSVRPEKGFKN